MTQIGLRCAFRAARRLLTSDWLHAQRNPPLGPDGLDHHISGIENGFEEKGSSADSTLIYQIACVFADGVC